MMQKNRVSLQKLTAELLLSFFGGAEPIVGPTPPPAGVEVDTEKNRQGNQPDWNLTVN